MKFSQYIKSLRQEKNFSQKGLADFLGFHFNTVAFWERGSHFPKDAQLKKISLRTGVPYLKLWVMAHQNSPFIIPVFSVSDLKNPTDHLPAPTQDEKSFWLLVDKPLEKQCQSVFKENDLLLVEPSHDITTGNWILKNGRIKKSRLKEKGLRISFKFSRV